LTDAVTVVVPLSRLEKAIFLPFGEYEPYIPSGMPATGSWAEVSNPELNVTTDGGGNSGDEDVATISAPSGDHSGLLS
jgi:hypothetical protein